MIFGFLVNMENAIARYFYSTSWGLFPQKLCDPPEFFVLISSHCSTQIWHIRYGGSWSIQPRENWFQYVRRKYAKTSNFPCLIALVLRPFWSVKKRKLRKDHLTFNIRPFNMKVRREHFPDIFRDWVVKIFISCFFIFFFFILISHIIARCAGCKEGRDRILVYFTMWRFKTAPVSTKTCFFFGQTTTE